MESGAKWAAFITGVVLLALAGVMLVRDWLDGADFSLALPVTLGLLGALALGVGMSRAPLDPRAARAARESAAARAAGDPPPDDQAARG
jgi:membrane protein required for beta-lactamase induction